MAPKNESEGSASVPFGAVPSVALVIRSFNEERHIGRLLAGVERQDLKPDRIILVDSGSTDATVSIAQQFDRVTVVSITPEEFSFGRALNRGIAACETDIAVFASAHVYPVRTSWLEHLVEPFSDPDVVISYGRQLGDDRSRFTEQQLFNKWFPDSSWHEQDFPFNNNANAAVRISWWRDHPYDESLTGLEDVAAGQVALDDAKKIAYVSEAAIVHVHEENFSRLLNRYRREAIALKKVYPNSTMSVPAAVGLFASNVGTDLFAALKQRRLTAIPDIAVFRLAQFAGGYLGHRQSESVDAQLRRRLYYPRRVWRAPNESNEMGEMIDYTDSKAD